MLLQRDDPIPRDDRLLALWRRAILLLLLLAIAGSLAAILLGGNLPTGDPSEPFYVTMMGDRAG
jgi:hypothetical protein